MNLRELRNHPNPRDGRGTSDAFRELYSELVFDHGHHPRNFGPLASANRHAAGYNPLCGDRVELALEVDGAGVIHRAGFEGSGCAISTASASLLTEAVAGKSVDEALGLARAFVGRVTAGREAEADLGKLEALAGVHDYPARVKCATLAWRALESALAEEKPRAETNEEPR